MSQQLTIVTGASRGIGKALTERLIDKTALLSIADTDMEALNLLYKDHPNYHSLTLDLADKGFILEIEEWFDAQSKLFTVNQLIHNAGILSVKTLDKIEGDELREYFEVNAIAPVLLNKFLFNNKLFSQSARLVYLVSSAAKLEQGALFAGLSLYSASKIAMSELALLQQRECELLDYGKNIKVARIYPGVAMTDMQHYLHEHSFDPRGSSIKDLPYFSKECCIDGKLKRCKIPPEVSAAFLEWVLGLPDEKFNQLEEHNIYEAAWFVNQSFT